MVSLVSAVRSDTATARAVKAVALSIEPATITEVTSGDYVEFARAAGLLTLSASAIVR